MRSEKKLPMSKKNNIGILTDSNKDDQEQNYFKQIHAPSDNELRDMSV